MMDFEQPVTGYPRLIVCGADDAIAFFQNAFGGTLAERITDAEGRVVHAKLMLGEYAVSIVEEVQEWGWLSPETLGGSPVLMQLDFENCDEVAKRMAAHGSHVVVPIVDRSYGKREGRLRDPFGHLWVLSQSIAA